MSRTRLLGLLLAPFLMALGSLAHAASAFYYRSSPGEWIGQGATLLGRTPDWSVAAAGQGRKSIEFVIEGPAGKSYRLSFEADVDLVPGPYEEARWTPFRGPSNGIGLGGEGRGCESEGRFVVLESEFGPGDVLVRFAANFVHRCKGNEAPLFGEIRYDSTLPLEADVLAPDTQADPFALLAQSPVKAGAPVVSNRIAIYGVNEAVPISISGGEYSVNGGPFSAQAGLVQARDEVIVRMPASTVPGATATATLAAGGQSATLTAQTYSPSMVLTGMYFRSPAGEYVGQGATQLYLAPRDAVSAERTLDGGVHFHVLGADGGRFDLRLAGSGGAQLVPGTYEGAMRRFNEGDSAPGLDFTGNGNGCSTSSGRFVVHEARYSPDGSVEAFSVDFEQRCERLGSLLVGQLRFQSAVALSHLAGTPCSAEAVANCSADLAISQQVVTAAPGTGKDLVFRVVVTNAGSDTAYRTVARFTHFSTDFVWASPQCSVVPATPWYQCAVGDLPAGSSATFIVVARAHSSMVNSRAAVDGASGDALPADNEQVLATPVAASPPATAVFRYRLYSPATLEHHFTTDVNEYNTLGTYEGTWVQEGTVGKVLDNPGAFNGVQAIPYYRLYDTSTRWHHWTTDPNEYYTLAQFPSWNAEGVDGYILPSGTAGTTQLYRLTYPPVPGLHHWTIDANEYNALINQYGWVGEGGSGFVLQ